MAILRSSFAMQGRGGASVTSIVLLLLLIFLLIRLFFFPTMTIKVTSTFHGVEASRFWGFVGF
jgi:hypothetical protein